MKTLFALLIMFMACTIGLISIGIMIFVMGFAGAPGSMLYVVGEKTKRSALRIGGLILAAIGQSYVVGAYAVFVVGLLRWFSASRPDLPVWPLWIAAFIHSGAIPFYAIKERPEKPTASHLTLGLVVLAAEIFFFTAILAPQTLKPIYGWVTNSIGLTHYINPVNWTKEDYQSERHFLNAKKADDELWNMLGTAGQPGVPQSGISTKKIKELLALAIRESNFVTDDFLSKTHPDLPQQYSNYRQSLQGVATFFSNGNEEVMALAFKKYSDYCGWSNSHYKRFRLIESEEAIFPP